MTTFTLDPLIPYPDRDFVVQLAEEAAQAVDRDEQSPFVTLRRLGERGLLTLGRDGALTPQAAVVFDVATKCMATAFSLWVHRSTVLFFDAVGRDLPDGLAEGTVSGTTSMAPAFKTASGVGELTVKAQPVDGGLVLNGFVPWSSNLYAGGVIVVPVLAAGNDAQDLSKAYIVTVPVDAQGVSVKYQKNLMALDATESGFVSYQDVFVPEQYILTRDVPAFLSRVAASFLLLQASFCLGLAGAALENAQKHLDVAGGVFAEDFEQTVNEYHRLRDLLVAYVQNPQAVERVLVVQLRLDSSHLATTATRLELETVGGRGYITSSDTARRYREATFTCAVPHRGASAR